MKQHSKQQCNTSNIIRSSEIGQYLYCSMAWYLQRCGYQPESIKLDEGTQKHIMFGNSIDTIHHKMKRSHQYAVLSILFFIVVISSIFFEVLL
jgi:hypothetical protein